MSVELKLYDTLTREKRPFAPLDPSRVRMYVCGPTVYDFAHIGNARPVIVFDVLFRLLRHLYGQDAVTYVRNITDVDDKINARAAERGIDIRELTEGTYANFHEDVAALGCLAPTVEPRATEHIAEMKTLIERLVASGNAYVAEGHVLFSVPSMPEYGRLSKRSLDEMVAGARVDVAPYKRGDMDFVLWKPSKEGEPGWPSPAGIATPGRPGWHIECSAMAWKHLGETFDIHGGGIDLEFPHHENEIAQSRCAFHTPLMANFWMHNGFLQVEGEKMSKSLGNFFTIRELYRTKRFGGRRWKRSVLKFAMLQTYYRQPIDWSVRLLEQSEARFNRWRDFASERTIRKSNHALFDEFIRALSDDLNTPEAFAVVDRAIRSEAPSEEDRHTVYRILRFLGLRGKHTRIAKTAARFGAFLESVQSIPSNKWAQVDLAVKTADTQYLIEFKSPEVQLGVGLNALKEYAEGLNVHTSWSSLLASLKNNREKRYTPRKDLQVLANTLRHGFQDLGCFSRSDWDHIRITTLDRPRFKSGNVKPEAQLVAYLGALSNFSRSAGLDTPLHSQSLLSLKHELLREAAPPESDFEKQVRRLIADREAAKRERRYSDADRIRGELAALGVVLKDSKDGTTWEMAR